MKTITNLLLSFMLCISLSSSAQELGQMSKRIQAMSKEKDPEKNVAAMFSIIKDYQLDTIKNAEELDMLNGQVAISYVNVYAFRAFDKYIERIRNKFNQTSYLNMAADILLKSKTHLTEAIIMAQKTVAIYESYKDDPKARPSDFPVADWNRFIQMAAYPYYETYAQALYQQGDAIAALFYEEKAIAGKKIEELMQSSIEFYTEILENAGQKNKAYNLLLKMASLGKASLKMNVQLKKILTTKLGERKSNLFLDSLQRNIDKAYKIEIAKKIITNVQAPNFTIRDLKGKSVSLTDFKGKVVVLDFWATWCAPCIAAMPAMKKISELHPEVVFLFVATQETGIDAQVRIQNYVRQNNFPLQVLIDKASPNTPKVFPVVTAYKIKGIPAKMVIDKYGQLRFATEGYSSDSELINELEAMIAIAKVQ